MATRFLAQGFRQSNESSFYPCPYPLVDLIPPPAAALEEEMWWKFCIRYSALVGSRARKKCLAAEKFLYGNICDGVFDGTQRIGFSGSFQVSVVLFFFPSARLIGNQASELKLLHCFIDDQTEWKIVIIFQECLTFKNLDLHQTRILILCFFK